MGILRQDSDGTIRQVCHLSGLIWHPTSERAYKSQRLHQEHDGIKRKVRRCDCGGWHVEGCYGERR